MNDILLRGFFSSVFLFVIFWVLVSLVFFLIIREIVLWYFRINENTNSLLRIADSLEIIAIAHRPLAKEVGNQEKENNEIKSKFQSTKTDIINNDTDTELNNLFEEKKVD